MIALLFIPLACANMHAQKVSERGCPYETNQFLNRLLSSTFEVPVKLPAALLVLERQAIKGELELAGMVIAKDGSLPKLTRGRYQFIIDQDLNLVISKLVPSIYYEDHFGDNVNFFVTHQSLLNKLVKYKRKKSMELPIIHGAGQLQVIADDMVVGMNNKSDLHVSGYKHLEFSRMVIEAHGLFLRRHTMPFKTAKAYFQRPLKNLRILRLNAMKYIAVESDEYSAQQSDRFARAYVKILDKAARIIADTVDLSHTDKYIPHLNNIEQIINNIRRSSVDEVVYDLHKRKTLQQSLSLINRFMEWLDL
ncbi:MAG: hypothetical protein ISR65_13985 [Bacteriovoracaceae bacterium]|nr:hypothetical protein [Bacteriovoracaceae bacterium]